jgi:hypothetical protein
MTPDLQVALCHSINARALLYGAEQSPVARRLYWRELSSVERLLGNMDLAAGADRLGGEA